MGAGGFWDDQAAAAKVSAEHARVQRRLDEFRSLESDVGDLEELEEMAAEDESIAAEVEEQRASIESRLAELEEARLFSGDYDAGDAVVTVNAGAGGTDSQDWAEMLLRTEMRWAERRGMKVELKEASRGGGGRHQVGHLPRQGRERLRPVLGREGRAPAGADLAVRLRRAPPHRVRRRRGGAAGGGDRRRRDRARRPPDRHLPRVGRRRPAREQDRLGGAHHPQAHGHRRAVPERALAVGQQGHRDGDAARRS